LLGGFYVFGSPSSLLFRSDLAREGKPLFKQSPYPAFCDQEACYSSLSDWDFGFVHQVLTYTRLHEGSSTSRDRTSGLNVDEATRLYVLAQYGRTYLSDDEYRGRLDDLLRRYYRFLGSQALRMRGNEFWTYHGTVLGQAGRPIRWERVAGACIAGAARSLLRPASLLKRAFRPL
jgi:hypothetical protein